MLTDKNYLKYYDKKWQMKAMRANFNHSREL